MPRSSVITAFAADNAASTSFAPTDITGLELWLDASDETTITDSGGAVSQWDDKSGNDRHATQSGSTLQPTTGTQTINSLNVIDFDGTEYMDLPDGTIPTGSGTYDVFLVVEMNDATPSNKKAIISQGVNSNDQYFNFRVDTDFSLEMAWWFNTLDGTAGDVTNATPQILNTRWDSTNRTNLVNGSQTGQDAPGAVKNTAATDSQLGGEWVTDTSRFPGRIAEVLVYSQALNASDVSSVETYLADKWSITLA